MNGSTLDRLAGAFGLEVTQVARPEAFDTAIGEPMVVVSSLDAAIVELLEGGPIRGARSPRGVIGCGLAHAALIAAEHRRSQPGRVRRRWLCWAIRLVHPALEGAAW